MPKRQFGGFPSKADELAYKAAWRAENKAKVADYMTRYREKNPDRDHEYYERKKTQIKARTKAWRLDNPKKRQAYHQDWIKRHPGKQREYALRHKWKLSIEQWNALWTACGGACTICRDPFDLSSKARHAHVDHCHRTGKIRALLCNLCNQGLGQFRDRPDLMRTAIAYLATHGTT